MSKQPRQRTLLDRLTALSPSADPPQPKPAPKAATGGGGIFDVPSASGAKKAAEEDTLQWAADLVPCHVGNFHGQRWVFAPNVASAFRDANSKWVASTRFIKDRGLHGKEKAEAYASRPVVNFRDPVRAAHYDVPGIAIELLGNMNCVSSLREIHAVHAKESAANGQSSWGLEEFVEHSADFFLAVDSVVQVGLTI